MKEKSFIWRRDEAPLIIPVPGQVHVKNIELIILEVFVDEQKIKVVNMLGVAPPILGLFESR